MEQSELKIPEDLQIRHAELVRRHNQAHSYGDLMPRAGYWMDHEARELALIQRLAQAEAPLATLGRKISDEEWISVKDRLPTESGMVLVWRGIVVVPAEYWPPSNDSTLLIGRSGFYAITDESEFMHGITHWQPPPKPPEARVAELSRKP